MLFRNLLTLLPRFLAALLLPMTLYAQAGSGELTGEVRDPSAAAVANATVTLTRRDTNQTYTSKTTEAGVYSFSNLKPGIYVAPEVGEAGRLREQHHAQRDRRQRRRRRVRHPLPERLHSI